MQHSINFCVYVGDLSGHVRRILFPFSQSQSTLNEMKHDPMPPNTLKRTPELSSVSLLNNEKQHTNISTIFCVKDSGKIIYMAISKDQTQLAMIVEMINEGIQKCQIHALMVISIEKQKDTSTLIYEEKLPEKAVHIEYREKIRTPTTDQGGIVRSQIETQLIVVLENARVIGRMTEKPFEVQLEKQEKITTAHITSENKYVVGGKDALLTVYDSDGRRIWREKQQVDSLDLIIPIWHRAIDTDPTSPNIIVSGTGHHELRLYNYKKQRRPLVNLALRDFAITCVKALPSFAIYGDASGGVRRFDYNLKKPTKAYKGGHGAIKCIAVADSLLATASLDYHLRIYDLHTAKLLSKIYCKQHLSAVVWGSISTQFQQNSASLPSNSNSINIKNEDDEVWNELEQLTAAKRQKKITL